MGDATGVPSAGLLRVGVLGTSRFFLPDMMAVVVNLAWQGKQLMISRDRCRYSEVCTVLMRPRAMMSLSEGRGDRLVVSVTNECGVHGSMADTVGIIAAAARETADGLKRKILG